jgi:hypothetical protein
MKKYLHNIKTHTKGCCRFAAPKPCLFPFFFLPLLLIPPKTSVSYFMKLQIFLLTFASVNKVEACTEFLFLIQPPTRTLQDVLISYQSVVCLRPSRSPTLSRAPFCGKKSRKNSPKLKFLSMKNVYRTETNVEISPLRHVCRRKRGISCKS